MRKPCKEKTAAIWQPFFYGFLKRFCKRLRIVYNLLLVNLKLRFERFPEADGFCGDDMH